MSDPQSLARASEAADLLVRCCPDDAEELMRALDARLSPWTSAGEVPTEDGEYFIKWHWAPQVRPLACEITGAALVVHHPSGATTYMDTDDDALKDKRFRRRWTLEDPE